MIHLLRKTGHGSNPPCKAILQRPHRLLFVLRPGPGAAPRLHLGADGVGLGGDRFAGEFSRSGDEVDDRVRAEKLDECLEILTAGWSGETVDHHGKHYMVDSVRFEPRPVPGRIPIWCAGFPGNLKPIRRAARYDGYFPVNLTSPDQVATPRDQS